MLEIMTEEETPSEIDARREIEAFYGQPLDRVAVDERPTPDFKLTVPGTRPAGFEVKELMSRDYKQLQAAMERQPTSVETPALERSWHVLLEAKPLSDRLVAPPNFPEDDEDLIASWADHGFVVQRKADRIEDWKRSHSTSAPPVRLRNLLADLIPPLAVLEAHEIFQTRGAEPPTIEALSALRQIEGRTNGAICLGHEALPHAGMPAGIRLNSGWSFVRTGNPNTLVERVQAWLDSDLSRNLIESLSRDEYGERHGVLVFDSMEPELQTVLGDPLNYLPTESIDLPAPLTHIWCLLGPIVLRFSSDGWQRRDRGTPP